LKLQNHNRNTVIIFCISETRNHLDYELF